MVVAIIIAIGFVICWLSLVFERCYKFHQDILYKMHLSDNGEEVVKPLDSLLDELDNFPEN